MHYGHFEQSLNTVYLKTKNHFGDINHMSTEFPRNGMCRVITSWVKTYRPLNFRIASVVLGVNLWEMMPNFCIKVFPSTINKPRLVKFISGYKSISTLFIYANFNAKIVM